MRINSLPVWIPWIYLNSKHEVHLQKSIVYCIIVLFLKYWLKIKHSASNFRLISKKLSQNGLKVNNSQLSFILISMSASTLKIAVNWYHTYFFLFQLGNFIYLLHYLIWLSTRVTRLEMGGVKCIISPYGIIHDFQIPGRKIRIFLPEARTKNEHFAHSGRK